MAVLTAIILSNLTEYSTVYYYQITLNNNSLTTNQYTFKTLPSPDAEVSIAVYGGFAFLKEKKLISS